MEFNYSYDPADDPKLSSATSKLMRATRNHWRDLGLSVQYYSDITGKLTEWSFSSENQKEAFIKRNLKDKPYAVSSTRKNP